MEQIEKFLKCLVQDPRNEQINFDLAHAYEKEKQYAIALSYYLRCAEFTKNNVLASECLLRCSFLMNNQGGRGQKALHFIKQSITASPCSMEPYYTASLYYSWRGQWKDSYLYACLGINIYENNLQTKEFRIKAHPYSNNFYTNYNIYFQKALSGSKIGKLNEARTIYTKILYNLDLPERFRGFIVQKINALPEPNHPIISYTKEKNDKLKFSFKNCEQIINNFSQIYQDMFALSMADGKKDGTYLEVGSGHFKRGNNTFLLETQFNWKGVSLDINNPSIIYFNNNRKNKGICADATKMDYGKLLSDNYNSTNIDYLQLDCDPPNITFDILQKIPFDKYKFGAITYEHDFYNDITGSYRKKSREFLKTKGYKLICGNISPLKDKYPFEDWWIHPDLIDESIYKLFERDDDTPINGEEYMLTKTKKLNMITLEVKEKPKKR
jgi:hypothetical protein